LSIANDTKLMLHKSYNR